MASSSGSKRRKLASDSGLLGLLHTGGISRSGLHEVLTKLRESDVLEQPTTIYQMRKVEDDLFHKLRRHVSVPTLDGGVFLWEFVDPNKYLIESAHRRANLQAIFAEAIRRSPPSAESPWNLIIGFDEYTPGCIESYIVSAIGCPTCLSEGGVVHEY